MIYLFICLFVYLFIYLFKGQNVIETNEIQCRYKMVISVPLVKDHLTSTLFKIL